MGSPLAPILANLFTGHHEEQWIDSYKDSQLLYYRRYVDDTFCLFHNEQDAMKFLSYLNSRHPNIRFTFETQLNGKLPFLDVLVDNSGASCITSVYHKSTYTGLLTNFFSFTCFKYKVALIYTLVDRIFKINNTTTGREKDLRQLSITLQRNSFPSHLIDKIIKGYENKFSSRPIQNNTSTIGENTTGVRYFKLPYVGDFFTVTRKKLKHLLDVFCKDIDIRIVFSSFKIKNFFSFKDPIPDALKSLVVYQFTCAGCNSRYIGETSRHFATRVKEHLSTDKNSHVYKHLNGSPSCKRKCSVDCFKIVDSANSRHCLKLKEAIYISRLKPELNAQLQHNNDFCFL